MPGSRLMIELVGRAPLSSRVDRLRFAALSPFRWAAGQHLVIVRAAEQELFLPYSIASAYDGQRPGEFELAAAINAGAEVIDRLPVGGRLEAEGPAGDFTWQARPRPAALLVGIGTGIAPLRALIEEELARISATRLLLLAGHREPGDVLFEADFARLASAHPRFRFIPTLTSAGTEWPGQRGRVQAQLVEAVASLGPLDAYVCGRVDMVKEVVELLLAHGIEPERIRSEGY